MKLEEYREWLKRHGNGEERKAYEVAERVIRYHRRRISTPWGEDVKVDVRPREVIKDKGHSYECDLVIRLYYRTFKRKIPKVMTIGIEFKEFDFQKVVAQALERQHLFDYTYIATRPVVLSLSYDPVMFAELIKHGIGWVLWSEDLVYLLLPAKKYWEEKNTILKYLAEIGGVESYEDV